MVIWLPGDRASEPKQGTSGSSLAEKLREGAEEGGTFVAPDSESGRERTRIAPVVAHQRERDDAPEESSYKCSMYILGAQVGTRGVCGC